MSLCKGNTVIFHIIAWFSYYLSDLVSGTTKYSDQIAPENILIAWAADSTIIFLRKLINFLSQDRRRIMRKKRFFTSWDRVYSGFSARKKGNFHILHKAHSGNNTGIRFFLTEYFFRFFCILNNYSFFSTPHNVADIFPNYFRTDIKSARDFSAFFKDIPHRIHRHFPTTILSDF